MLRDTSSKGSTFPKTLLIRNTVGGMIWQVYHVDNLKQAETLSNNAAKNGFEDGELVDFKENYGETWPYWKKSEGGKKIVEDSLKEV